MESTSNMFIPNLPFGYSQTSGTPEEVQRRLNEFNVQNDDAQQLMDFEGQQQEDVVGQQFMDFGQQSMNEDFTQQRMDLTADDRQQQEDTQRTLQHIPARQDSTNEEAEVCYVFYLKNSNKLCCVSI